jgi:hypothetical protein
MDWTVLRLIFDWAAAGLAAAMARAARLIFMAGEARRGDIFLSPECNLAHARALARDERVIAALTPLVS